MSAQMMGDIYELQQRMNACMRSIETLTANLAAAVARLDADSTERKAIRRETNSMTERIDTLWALREAIEKDARATMNARSRIDPTKVKMPATLKRLGYGKERR